MYKKVKEICKIKVFYILKNLVSVNFYKGIVNPPIKYNVYKTFKWSAI